MDTSLWCLLLSGPVIALGLLRYRSDYRRHGFVTPVGVALLLVAWLMPHLVLGYSFPMFSVPRTVHQWAGYGLMGLGLVSCEMVLRGRFSLAMTVGVDADTLLTGGPYRWSRNPQYVAYAPFIVGYALTGMRATGWAGVALWLVLVHLIVLVEEEHLERRFGDRYRRYRTRTPRYLLR